MRSSAILFSVKKPFSIATRCGQIFADGDPTVPAGSPGTNLSDQITGITPLDIAASHGPNDLGTTITYSVGDTLVQEPSSGQTMATFTVVLSQSVGSLSLSTPQYAPPTAAAAADAPWYVPATRFLAGNPSLRPLMLAVAAALVVVAFTFLHDTVTDEPGETASRRTAA